MAKRIKKKSSRRKHPRVKREERMKRWVVASTIAVGVLIVGVLIYGYVTEVVLKAREPMAIVNGVPIRTDDVEARVQYQLIQSQQSAEQAPFIRQQVLQQMVVEELIRQEAEERGISVTPAEVDEAVQRYFNFSPEAAADDTEIPLTGPLTETEVTTPTTMTEEEFQTLYETYAEQVLRPAGLDIEDFREILRTSLLYEQVRAQIVSDIPPIADQVEMRYFAFPEEEQAVETLQLLEEGEEWTAIAEEYEADEESAVYVRELDWRTKGFVEDQFGSEIAEVVFNAPLEIYPEPVVGLGGRYYVIEVTGHEERELSDEMVRSEQDRVFYDWVSEQMEDVEFVGEGASPIPSL